VLVDVSFPHAANKTQTASKVIEIIFVFIKCLPSMLQIISEKLAAGSKKLAVGSGQWAVRREIRIEKLRAFLLTLASSA
jgi:hypothetical protein